MTQWTEAPSGAGAILFLALMQLLADGAMLGLWLVRAGRVNGCCDVLHDGCDHCYVNNGTGIWPGFAMRLGRSAELTRITLRRRM